MTALMLAIALFSPTPPSGPASGPTSAPTVAAVHGADASPGHRGAAFALKKRTRLDTIVADPSAYSAKTVQVEATIKAVCKKKGCWLVLEGDKPEVVARVTMKGYGFFAPRDSDGKKVVVEGAVEVKTLAEAERAHLAEDGKTSIDAIPKHEVRIVATGLRVL